MSEMGLKWQRLSDWILHLQRKKTVDTPINPDRDTYKDGFGDCLEMVARWMAAEDLSPTFTTDGKLAKTWKKEGT
jgi:hypothetical protein